MEALKRYDRVELVTDPMVPEALQMFEILTQKEGRKLSFSQLQWVDTVEKIDGEEILRLRLPVVTFYYKFPNHLLRTS